MIAAWLVATGFAAVEVESYPLSADDGAFVSAGSPGQWAWGEVSSGPLSGHTGSQAWATVLDGAHTNNATDRLIFPGLDLSGLDDPAVSWWQWVLLEQGDSGVVEIQDGSGTWNQVDPVYGYPSTEGFTGHLENWERVTVDLSGVADLSRVRLTFRSNASVASAGWYVDDVVVWDGDAVGPLLTSLTQLEDTEDLVGPYMVSLFAEDDVGLQFVNLVYALDAEAEVGVPMQFLGAGLFEGAIPGQDHDTLVSYRVEAGDQENTTVLPTDEDHLFRVRLPAPLNLDGPEGTVHAAWATLTWEPPETGHTLLGYTLYREEEVEAQIAATEATVSLWGDGQDTFSVAARFDVGLGDRTENLVLDSAPTKVLGFTPAGMFQDDFVRVDLVGANLLFVQGDLEIDLGAGITVEEIVVEDVNLARVLLRSEPDVEASVRDVTVRSGSMVVVGTDVFAVAEGVLRPRLVSIDPVSLRQGQSSEIEIQATEAFSSLPEVELGEGVYVEEVVFVDDLTVRASVVVDTWAPLGDRDVVVDDGLRLYQGVEFRVRDTTPPPVGCGHLPRGAAPWALWVGVLALLVRRDS